MQKYAKHIALLTLSPFEEYLKEKKSVYILKPCQEKDQVYEEISLVRT